MKETIDQMIEELLLEGKNPRDVADEVFRFSSILENMEQGDEDNPNPNPNPNPNHAPGEVNNNPPPSDKDIEDFLGVKLDGNKPPQPKTSTPPQSETDKNAKKEEGRWKRMLDSIVRHGNSTNIAQFLRLPGRLREAPNKTLMAGAVSAIVALTAMYAGIKWIMNRHLREIGIIAVGKAQYLASLEGIILTTDVLKRTFKRMVKDPYIKGRIKRYLRYGSSVGMKRQAIENIGKFMATEIVKRAKREGAIRAHTDPRIPHPANAPGAMGYIHPPGFHDPELIPGASIVAPRHKNFGYDNEMIHYNPSLHRRGI